MVSRNRRHIQMTTDACSSRGDCRRRLVRHWDTTWTSSGVEMSASLTAPCSLEETGTDYLHTDTMHNLHRLQCTYLPNFANSIHFSCKMEESQLSQRNRATRWDSDGVTLHRGSFYTKNRDFWSIYNWLESDMLDVLHCTYFPESCTIRLEYDHTQISVSSKFRQMTLDQWGVLHKNSRFSSNISLGTSIGTCMRSIKWWYCRWTPVTVEGLNSSLIITKGPNGHLQCYAVWQCSNNHWIYHKTFSGKNTAYPYMYEDNCNDRTSWNATISAVVFDRKDCLRLYSWSSNLMFHRTSRREAARCMPRVCSSQLQLFYY